MKKNSVFVLSLIISFFLLSTITFLIVGYPNVSYAKEKADSKKIDTSLTYVADVVHVEGEGLRIKRTNSPHWLFGKINMPDYVQDVIETDKNTVACIEFLNGSQVGINKGTKIEIVSSYQVKDITQRSSVEKIILKSGTIWAKVRGQKQPLQVQAGKGVLGIKGTEFLVESDPSEDTEKVTVLEGEVEYTTNEGQTESVTSGEEITVKEKRIQRRRVALQKLRDVLNARFPGLSPKQQAIRAVFACRLMARSSWRTSNALGIANQTTYLVENPDSYIKNRANSEVSRRTGVHIPGGIFGRRPKQQKKNTVRPKIISPRNDTIVTYYPKFTWEKVDGAKSYRVLVSRKRLQKGESDPLFYMYAKTDKTELEYPSYGRPLKPDNYYFWTVIPLGDDNKPIGRAAKPARFKMADYATLGVKGFHPCGYIEPASGDLVFEWSPVAGVKTYKIEIASNHDMNEPVVSKTVDTNSFTLENSSLVLSKEKDYYWQVTPVEKEDGTPEMQGAVNHFKIEVIK